jgi:hypothetical protein
MKKVYTGDFKTKLDVLDAVCETDVGYDQDDLAWAMSGPGEYELTEEEKWWQKKKEEDNKKFDRQRSIVIEKYIEEKRIEYENTGIESNKCALCVINLSNKSSRLFNCPNKYCKNYN